MGGKVLITSGDAGLIARSCCCTPENPCGTCYSTYRYRLFSAGAGATTTVVTPVPCPSVGLTVTGDIPAVWQASTAYAVGDWVRSSTGSPPYTYRCTTAGTSGASEPTWGPVTVNDNTVVWTLGSFSVDWCGEKWELPEQSGQTRTVCPDDDYELRRTYYKTTTGFGRAKYRFIHEWSNDPVANEDLLLRRQGYMEYLFRYNPFPTKQYYARDVIPPGRAQTLEIWDNNTDAVFFYQTFATSIWLPATVPVSVTSTFLSEIGQITTYTYPRWNNFLIPDAFFGSAVLATDAGNATFTWEKGQDWPS